jgi:biotin operon repressor
MSDSEGRADPPSIAAIRDALENQAVEVRRWATRRIEEVEKHRDEELQRLDGALACVQDERNRPPRRQTARPARHAGRAQRKPAATNPAAVRERCEAVARLLVEVERPLAPKEIRQTLNLTSHTVTTALKRLVRERRVKRSGNGPTARYAAKGNGSGGNVAKPFELSTEGGDKSTLQGRILTTLQDRGYASADELAQATGASRAEVVQECGVLLKEEEIHMERREGRAVYVWLETS